MWAWLRKKLVRILYCSLPYMGKPSNWPDGRFQRSSETDGLGRLYYAISGAQTVTELMTQMHCCKILIFTSYDVQECVKPVKVVKSHGKVSREWIGGVYTITWNFAVDRVLLLSRFRRMGAMSK